MKDWKGNTIQPNDIVLSYLFRNSFNPKSLRWINLKTGTITPVKNPDMTDYWKWNLLHTFKFTLNGPGTFIMDVSPDQIQIMNYQLIDIHLTENINVAICIKDISDNREEFMLHHFA